MLLFMTQRLDTPTEDRIHIYILNFDIGYVQKQKKNRVPANYMYVWFITWFVWEFIYMYQNIWHAQLTLLFYNLYLIQNLLHFYLTLCP